MSEFKIYSSSAGSGKTYTLTKTYLILALKNPNYLSYKKILAITFTNDAASEMKSRILEALKDFSSENFDDSNRFYGLFMDILTELPQFSEKELIENSKKVFHSILEDYSDFNVKTIDSFVNQIVSAFTLDLKLPFNYEIQLDSISILTEAVNRMFLKIGNHEYKELYQTIIDFALSKLDEGKSWNTLTEELVGFGTSLLNDESALLLEKNKDLEFEDFNTIRKQIKKYFDEIEEKISMNIELIFDALEAKNLNSQDFIYTDNGVYGFFAKIKKNPLLLLDPKLSLKRVNEAQTKDSWTSKNTPLAIVDAIDSIKPILNKNISEMLDLINIESNKFNILFEIKKNIQKISLLKSIKEEFEIVLEEKNQVLISEFNRKISNIVSKEPVPFIYERLGEKYDHILIDEFQDTSDLQFFNLLPLIENSLSKNNFNMIVGDPKQSIYRWRGGNVDLMIHLLKNEIDPLTKNDFSSEIQEVQLKSLSNFIKTSSLNTNFRSKKEIVEFNNSFFEKIIEKYASIYPKLDIVFSDYKQLSKPNAGENAHIELELIPYEKEDVLTLKRIKEIIILQLEAGYSLSDIAVLTRGNSNAAKIAEFLNSEGFSIVSKDSLLIKNSLPVNVLIAFLELLNDPSKILTRYEALYLLQKFNHGDIPSGDDETKFNQIINIKNPETFFEELKKQDIEIDIKEISTLNTYGKAEHICGNLNLFKYGNESKYLFTFLDILLEFTNTQSVSLGDFLDYWKTIKDSKSVSSSLKIEAITVTTIHKAKGLEYPIVLMPYTNWGESKKKASKWLSLENYDWKELKSKDKQLISAPFTISDKFEKGDFKEEILKENEMKFLENLNMLYVSMTRPTDKLFIMSRQNYHFKPEGVGLWLNEYLSDQGTDWELNKNVVISNCEIKYTTKDKAKNENLYLLDTINHDNLLPKLKIKSNAAKLYDLENFEKSIEKGNKIHATFAKIKTKKDIEDALRSVKIEGIINELETEEIRAAIIKTIEHKQISFLFEDQGLIVETEKDILQKGKDILRPDRVVFINNEVYVLDYKTGIPKNIHEKQIKEYGHLFKQMGYKKIHLYLVYLDPIEIKEIE